MGDNLQSGRGGFPVQSLLGLSCYPLGRRNYPGILARHQKPGGRVHRPSLGCERVSIGLELGRNNLREDHPGLAYREESNQYPRAGRETRQSGIRQEGATEYPQGIRAHHGIH